MSNATLPGHLFVGTAKAGTTTIEQALRLHPRVGIPRKETFFFDHDMMGGGRLPYPMQRDPATIVTSGSEYRNLYAGLEGKVPVEIGTGYLYHHEVSIPRIRSVLGPDTRIGIVLRDPVERAWSSYMHFVKDTHEPLGFRESVAHEAERTAEGWDFMWHHIAMGMYAGQVAAYRVAFPHVQVFFFEDLRKDPVAFMHDVFRWVGVEPVGLDRMQARNRSGQPMFPRLQRLITTENPLKAAVRPLLRLLVPEERRQQARKYLKEKNMKAGAGLSAADRAWLRDIYRADVEQLSSAMGMDLFARWRW
ncbi:MAG TPA: sulfotransferase [Flavobacteriales bacterium]|nr:sulfotransferase [Flavobacteriales bacterium]